MIQVRAKAPWPDYAGNNIHLGDTLQHPDGTTCKVIYAASFHNPWRCQYADLTTSALVLQIGAKGQAVVKS